MKYSAAFDFRFLLRLLSVVGAGLFSGRASLAQSTAGWSQADVGIVTPAGSVNDSGGVISVSGAGADVWGAADAFHYYYQSWTGDGTFVVRVTGLSNTDAWAKAGIMLRSDLSAGSAHTFVSVNPDRYASAISRQSAGGISSSTAALNDVDRHMPMWLKLTRAGTYVFTYLSADGSTWTSLSTTSVTLPDTILVGLAVTSHVDGTLATASFDNFSAVRPQPDSVKAVARTPNRITVSWQDGLSSETGWELERSTDNSSFGVIYRTGPGYFYTFTYKDEAVSPATTYYYRVRAQTAAGPTDYSPTFTVTTPPASPAGWSAGDVGNTIVGGQSKESAGVFSITGAGAGIGGVRLDHESAGRGDLSYHISGASDEMQLCSRLWSGDGEFVARISELTGGDSAHAGLVLRSGLNPSDGYVFCGVQGAQGLTLRTRATGTSSWRETSLRYSAATGWSRPMWIKLVRAYGGVMSYASSDGANWQEIGWVTNALADPVTIGLATSSGVPTAAATATFDHVSIGPLTTAIPAPAAPTDFAVTDITATSVQLKWTNSGYDTVELEQSTDGVNFTALTGFGFSSYGGAISPATRYTFRVRGLRGTLPSAWVSLSVTGEPAPAPATNLTAVATSPTRVDLRWTDNTNGLARYEIYRSTDNLTFSYLVGYFNTGTTSHTDMSVSAGRTYYYRVRAINGSMSADSVTVGVNTSGLSPTGGPTITVQPSSQAVALASAVTLATGTTASNPSYQWLYNGSTLGASSGSSFTISSAPGMQPRNTGIYSAVVTDGSASLSRPAILGLISPYKVVGDASEIGTDIVHPNGNVYDQIALLGAAASIKADPGQVARLSFIDLNSDIVQVEFTGAGTLSLVLANPSGPAPASSYNQPGVNYLTGHAGIVIAGADETTNVSVFSVGRITAVNQALFRDVNYDGVADIAFIAILSSNGKFGGVRTANTSYFATSGLTGIYAPNVSFVGPVYVGDVSASGTATATLILGSADEVKVTGGDLAQLNGAAVQVSGIGHLRFVDGSTSHGDLQKAQTNKARIVDVNGVEVTSAVVVNPAP